MSIIFDGKSFANKKIEVVKKQVSDLKTRGIFLHLATIIIGSDPASKLYVNLKKKKAESIGIEVSVYVIPEIAKKDEVVKLISMLNIDKCVTGIMIQLPIPGELSKCKKEFINLIDSKKDVDGLKKNSGFTHPTAQAVLEILEFAQKETNTKVKTVSVFGEKGMVGSSVVKLLIQSNYKIVKDSKFADAVISAVGKKRLVTSEMVKKDAIVIDVGSPKGDVDFKEVEKKASFITPVPGGVGPVTIACLLENLVK